MLNSISLALVLAASQSADVAPLDAVPQTRLDADLRCLLGVYVLPKGGRMTITGTDGQPRGLQYTLGSGQFGKLHEDASGSFSSGAFVIDFESCSVGTMKLTKDNITQKGVRIRLIEKQTTFTSEGIELHGKLVLPANGRAKSAAVWVEGSNNNPSTDDAVWQYELASRGVASFVYDKRGTGASTGVLSSDFHVRAGDTAAAVKEVRRLSSGIKRVGVIGASQGGWVAPLTATKIDLDFVITAFAMAEGPIAQDQDLVEQQLIQAGFDNAVVAQASELTKITEKIVRSNMREGLAELDAFKVKHANASWLTAIQPRSYTGIFLKFSSSEIKAVGPAMAQGLTFDFNPRPIISEIKPRQLWLLGGSDQQAPNAKTQVILRQLQQQRSGIAVVIFPNADHGLIEQTTTADGVSMVYSPKQFDIAADWIKNGKLPASGNFIVMPKASRP